MSDQNQSNALRARISFLRPILPTVLVGLTCCTNLSNVSTSESHEGQAGESSPRIGLHYCLPRGKIRITGSNQKSDSEHFFKITTVRVLEPDRAKRFFLKYEPSFFYDDDFTLEVDDNGLLKTANSTSTDQTPTIIESATEIAINLLKIGAEFGAEAAKAAPSPTPRPFVYTFDPLNTNERTDAENFLGAMGIILKVDCRKLADSGIGKGTSKTATTTSSDGVFYRPPVAVTLNFSIGKEDALDTKDSVVYILPDYHFLECLSLRRAALVKQDTQLTFSNGMLQHVKFNRPSQALAAVQIPQKIVSKVAEAVPAIIKIQSEAATRNLKDQTAILQAQRDFLQAQIDLRKKQAELDTLLQQKSTQKETVSQNLEDNNASGRNPNSVSPISSASSGATEVQPSATPKPQ